MNIRKSYLLLIFSTLLVGIIAGFIIYKNESTGPQPSPSPANLSWEGITPGLSTTKQLLDALGQPLDITQEKGQTIYKYQSNNPYYPNHVVLKDENVRFIKEIVTQKDGKNKSSLKQQWGLSQPDAVLYEDNDDVYPIEMFLEKGVGIKGHKTGETVLEVWYFEPTVVSDFLENFGDRLSLTIEPEF